MANALFVSLSFGLSICLLPGFVSFLTHKTKIENISQKQIAIAVEKAAAAIATSTRHVFSNGLHMALALGLLYLWPAL